MSARRVQIVLLGEDLQQVTFARRVLSGLGWDTRNMRVSIPSSGSGEQWVREKFPDEIKAYRQRSTVAATALIAIVDADAVGLQYRMKAFMTACTSKKIQFRTSNEAVAIAVPKRNIETWIRYLNGEQVDEQSAYPKLNRERDCQPAVNKLLHFCKSTGIRQDAPAALVDACNEYNIRIKPSLV